MMTNKPPEAGRERTRARVRPDEGEPVPRGRDTARGREGQRAANAAAAGTSLKTIMPSASDAPWRNPSHPLPGGHAPEPFRSHIDDLPPTHWAKSLSADAKAAMVAAAAHREATLCYSTLAMVLAQTRQVRLAELHGAGDVTFAAMLNKTAIGHRELVRDYNGGTCFTLAASLIEALHRDFQVQAFSIVRQGSVPDMAVWPGMADKRDVELISDISEHCWEVGHVDVVVPYQDGATRRCLLLPTGQPDDAPASDVALDDAIDASRGWGRLLDAPDTLAYRALWGRARMHHMLPGSRACFGIDLFAGLMYVNGAARSIAQAQQRGNTAERGTFDMTQQFVFDGLPSRAVQPLTPEGARHWSDCIVFLAGVKKVFQFTADTADDLVFLIDRRDNFLTDVVHPLGTAVRDCYADRKKALAITATVDAVMDVRMPREAQRLLRNAHDHLQQARRSLVALDAPAARLSYQAAEASALQSGHSVADYVEAKGMP